jgi:oligoendopeptidase F
MGELESILEQADKPAVFAGLLHAADARPPAHGALIARTQEQGSAVRNQLLFFDLEWLAVEEEHAAVVIASPACARWRHHLASMRRYRPHTLSEPEEKLLEETANTGRRAFNRLFDETLSAMTFTVEIDGAPQTLTESGVLALLHDGRRDLRQRAAAALTDGLRQQSLMLTFVFNTIVQDHSLSDRLRGYPSAMSARHLANEIDAATVDALMTACERNADVVRDYYALKRSLLGVDVLYDWDRYAPLEADAPTVSWSKARATVLDAYGDFSPSMREIADEFFTGRWIDAEGREGKRGGAFSASTVPSAHPYVLLSYLGHPRDVMTLAHELGHGVHQYLARPRGYLQADTALTMAETASVFGEMLVFERLRRQEQSPRARLALLCGFIEEAFGTVFRQIALTRFEQGLHAARRAEGELSSERIGDIWLDVNACAVPRLDHAHRRLSLVVGLHPALHPLAVLLLRLRLRRVARPGALRGLPGAGRRVRAALPRAPGRRRQRIARDIAAPARHRHHAARVLAARTERDPATGGRGERPGEPTIISTQRRRDAEPRRDISSGLCVFAPLR